MAPAYRKLPLGQGETWRMTVRLYNPPDPDTGTPGTPMDITGYSARMQVRESLTSPAPLLSLDSSPGGGITVTGNPAALAFLIDDAVTAAFAWRYGVYDLEIESPSGDTTRLLYGEVEVTQEVTR